MSSGGWEVVGKNRRDKVNGKTVKLTKAEKKKLIENAPKVEDFLPLNQVKTLYDSLDNNKENKKPTKEKEYKTKENEEKKKQQQKQAVEKKKQEPKGKLPKTIKEAVNAINPGELGDILATAQARFPDAPLIWLKDLAAFLNMKIPVDKEDALFSGKSKDYPLNVVPKAITSTLEKAVEMAGQQTTQLFYEITLTAMATDMSKGVPVIGYKIFLQLLARLYPEMTIANIPKLISVRNSYQNRKPIGLSLLWVISQAGQKDLTVGLKVWHEVMSPMIETKSYANDVVQFLHDLVFGHENVQDLTLDLYLNVVEDAYSGKLNIPTNVGRDINNSIDKLRSILFKNKNLNCPKLFEMLIDNINQKCTAGYREELVKALVACLITDVHCFSIWRSLYMKHLYQSNLILTYIDAKWNTLHTSLKKKPLNETLIVFQTTNERWKKGKEENLVLGCNKLCKSLLQNMTITKRRKFPWAKGSILLLILIGALVAWDCQKHGSFDASATGKLFRDSGISDYGQKVLSILDRHNKHGASSDASSTYYDATLDICVPYVKLFGDLYLIVRNVSTKVVCTVATYVASKKPIVVETIDYYAPNITQEIYSGSVQLFELGSKYAVYGYDKAYEGFIVTCEWLETNVFVGKLSPDNIRSCAKHVIVTAQTFLGHTYAWTYEKVDFYAPRLTEEIHTRSIQLIDLGKSYSTYLGQQITESSASVGRWFGKNVFVGKLSPENLQDYATQAIDKTQTFASQTYDWVYEIFQTQRCKHSPNSHECIHSSTVKK